MLAPTSGSLARQVRRRLSWYSTQASCKGSPMRVPSRKFSPSSCYAVPLGRTAPRRAPSWSSPQATSWPTLRPAAPCRQLIPDGRYQQSSYQHRCTGLGCCGLDASLIGEATYCYQTTAIDKHLRKRTIAELYDSGHEPWLSCDEGPGQPGRCRFCGQKHTRRDWDGVPGRGGSSTGIRPLVTSGIRFP